MLALLIKSQYHKRKIMNKRQKKSLLKLTIEFIKLQLAGNVLFWGTYVGYFVLHTLMGWSELSGLATASIFAHLLFFVADKEWVFDDKTGKRKTPDEIFRFILFMGMNYFINIAIIAGLRIYFDIDPYIGQFIAGLFFTFWTFIGLRYWVFREMKHHAITVKKPKRPARHGVTGGRKYAR
jgi:putative flippase GtrA